ncbi:hypothetical protein BC831DRAFT_484125 [Entophlyctis helioformis]|nr:hypothetical protein BC831DRAFT_484125 [Entophlyctis helioformis]
MQIAAVLLLLISTALSVLAQTPTQSQIEAALALPANLTRFAVHKARGRSYYTCALVGPNTTEWITTNFEAKLYTVRRKKFLGTFSTVNISTPEYSWVYNADNSKVSATILRTTGDFATGNDLDTPLFQTTSLTPGSPTDFFANTAYIIGAYLKNGRVNPLARCDTKKVGRIRDQRFTAQFWYYRPV